MLFALICLIFSDDDDDIWPAGVEANQLQKKNAAAKKKNWRTGAGIGGKKLADLVEKIRGRPPKNSRPLKKKLAVAWLQTPVRQKNWRPAKFKRGLPKKNAVCQNAHFQKFAAAKKKIRGRPPKNSRPPKKLAVAWLQTPVRQTNWRPAKFKRGLPKKNAV